MNNGDKKYIEKEINRLIKRFDRFEEKLDKVVIETNTNTTTITWLKKGYWVVIGSIMSLAFWLLRK